MMHSNTAMIVVSAASDRKRKNTKPQMRPPVMLANTFGKAMKISPGPEVTSTPKLAQDGKMTSPARNATKVSIAMIQTDSIARECSRPT